MDLEMDTPLKIMILAAAATVASAARADSVDPATIALGQQVYTANCAACHGASLQGQPDWKHRLATGRMPAPPHDVSGHTWHHSDRDLFNLVNLGVAAVVGDGYESDMPAFGDKLSEHGHSHSFVAGSRSDLRWRWKS